MEPSATICGPRRFRKRFTVRMNPSGTIIWATGWDSLFGSLPEFGVPWRNVSYESEHIAREVKAAWGAQPDALHG